ncbi:hypothetical protein O181_058604 [Austropuccinia psidii MF-1]|uniref:Uncharacterized protein n=1 Tax=Austropuccinia psidii MF-1 TaxID=1389203 RepID=A0A9Q3HXT6_9BASI|nr:hypothetical protein [Austropuccinia psidii MF-1]
MRHFRGELEHSVKSRNTGKSSAEEDINILKEKATRIIIGSTEVNFKTTFNTPWKNSVERNPKEKSNNMKYKSEDTIRKLHILHRTTHLANTCPKRRKIDGIYIEKEPDVRKNIVNQENSADNS